MAARAEVARSTTIAPSGADHRRPDLEALVVPRTGSLHAEWLAPESGAGQFPRATPRSTPRPEPENRHDTVHRVEGDRPSSFAQRDRLRGSDCIRPPPRFRTILKTNPIPTTRSHSTALVAIVRALEPDARVRGVNGHSLDAVHATTTALVAPKNAADCHFRVIPDYDFQVQRLAVKAPTITAGFRPRAPPGWPGLADGSEDV